MELSTHLKELYTATIKLSDYIIKNKKECAFALALTKENDKFEVNVIPLVITDLKSKQGVYNAFMHFLNERKVLGYTLSLFAVKTEKDKVNDTVSTRDVNVRTLYTKDSAVSMIVPYLDAQVYYEDMIIEEGRKDLVSQWDFWKDDVNPNKEDNGWYKQFIIEHPELYKSLPK